jgi:hypothetical protein
MGMNLRYGHALLCAASLLLVPFPSHAEIIVEDFESFFDSDVLTTQIVGLAFSNTVVLTAAISLNEIEFPPHSGVNVAFDNGGAITVDFAIPVSSVGAFFTYVAPLSLTAYDSGLDPVGSETSSFSSNSVSSGHPPNEFVAVSAAAGIARIIILGDPSGSSFVMDDLTFETVSAVPEPGTLALAAVALAIGGIGQRRKTRCCPRDVVLVANPPR